jgi:CHASE2 domain-containing sensor protein
MKPSEVAEHELERLEGLIESGKSGFWVALRRSKATLFVLPIAVLLLHWWKVPAELSKATLDAAIAMQPRAEPRQVRIVAIDDEDYADLFASQSPLDVAALTKLLAAVAAGRPAMVVVDIDTSGNSFRALSAPSDLRIVWAMSDAGRKDGKFVALEPLGGTTLKRAWSKGLAEVPNDENGLVRGYQRVFSTDRGAIASLPLATADAYRATRFPGTLPTTTKHDRRLDFRYVFYPLNARAVLAYAKQPGWPQGVLRDTIVIVGGRYRAGRDQYATPVGVRDGVEIVAQAAQAEIDGTAIPESGPWLGVIEIVAGLLLIAVYQLFQLRMALFVSLALLPVLSVAGSYILYGRPAAWLVLMPVLVIVMVSELYTNALMYQKVSSQVLKFVRQKQAGDSHAPVSPN